MIEFSRNYLLWLLLAAPLLFWIYYRARAKRLSRIFSSFHRDAWDRLTLKTGNRSAGRAHLRELSALVLLVIALAGPRVGTRLEELKREGVDVIIAIDLSRSMLTQDISPDRLTRAKLEVQKFINTLKGDRVGLVGFAGVAHLQCPLTLDHSAAMMLLNVMDETLLPVQGTALAEAVDVAVKAFPETSDKRDRVLIIISDGEDHEQKVREAAEKAGDEGVIIYTLGVGTLKGGPIPVYSNNRQLTDYKRNGAGQIVTSQLEENSLRELADLTGGMYFRLYETKDPLNKIYSDISELDRSEFNTHDFSQYIELFQFFIIPALILFFWEFFRIFNPNLNRRKGRNEA